MDKVRTVEIFQVDAFARTPFRGNPAAVCLLTEAMPDSRLQAIAAEMNLSETAFAQPRRGSNYEPGNNEFYLRWFTPLVEVPLCGHATLATAKILFDEVGITADSLLFETKSGLLTARRYGGGASLDFPADEPVAVAPPQDIMAALGLSTCAQAMVGRQTQKLVLQVAKPADVFDLRPDFRRLRAAHCPFPIKGVGVTAYDGEQYDFVSRYFNPWAGVDEDPVTGSVHTLLATFWRQRLGKEELKAFQASPRGGELLLRPIADGRVELSGEAVIVLRGELLLD